MNYKGKVFEAIIATPGCGKNFLCDKYPEKFVDVDEERLRCKYIVPDNITREELEVTKGSRPFPRRKYLTNYKEVLYEKLDKFLEQKKTLIAAPHPEAFEYFEKRNITFCYVFPKLSIKEEIKRRLLKRNNPKETI